jgi:hypothetical protein
MPEGARRTRKGALAALDPMPTSGVLVVRGRPGGRSFAVTWHSGLRRHSVVLGSEREGWTERSAAEAVAGLSAPGPASPSRGTGAHLRRVRRIEKRHADG